MLPAIPKNCTVIETSLSHYVPVDDIGTVEERPVFRCIPKLESNVIRLYALGNTSKVSYRPVCIASGVDTHAIRRRREQGLQDRHLYNYTFANDNGQNPLMEKARAYVDGWDKAYTSNTGLLLFGDVGTGKSFFAGCIANALLDRDVSVMMTNFPTILSRLTGMFPEERIDYIDSIGRYDLLILDDLGVERNTSYAMEQMFQVVDRRYRSCKPLIVTTNLSLEQMKNAPDVEHSRIYGRILEYCAPILFSGKDMRKNNADTTKTTAREILSTKTTL